MQCAWVHDMSTDADTALPGQPNKAAERPGLHSSDITCPGIRGRPFSLHTEEPFPERPCACQVWTSLCSSGMCSAPAPYCFHAHQIGITVCYFWLCGVVHLFLCVLGTCIVLFVCTSGKYIRSSFLCVSGCSIFSVCPGYCGFRHFR